VVRAAASEDFDGDYGFLYLIVPAVDVPLDHEPQEAPIRLFLANPELARMCSTCRSAKFESISILGIDKVERCIFNVMQVY